MAKDSAKDFAEDSETSQETPASVKVQKLASSLRQSIIEASRRVDLSERQVVRLPHLALDPAINGGRRRMFQAHPYDVQAIRRVRQHTPILVLVQWLRNPRRSPCFDPASPIGQAGSYQNLPVALGASLASRRLKPQVFEPSQILDSPSPSNHGVRPTTLPRRLLVKKPTVVEPRQCR